MSDAASRDESLLDDDRMEALFEAFEQRLRDGGQPRIEDVLAGAAGVDPARLLPELIAAEIEFRCGRGESPSVDEYVARFPQFSDVIRDFMRKHLETVRYRAGESTRTGQPVTSADTRVLQIGAGDGSCEQTPRTASEPQPLRSGLRFGHYELGEEIASGGMGVVYRARDARLNREVAVKCMRPQFAGHPGAAERFLLEAQITGQLQHPGVPAVHELGTLPDSRLFLAMKLVKGQTLADLLDNRRAGSVRGDASIQGRRAGSVRGGASIQGRRADAVGADRGRFIAIFEQVCQAVGYAHSRRVIHRDLTPRNVMVGAFGEVQVMDWGLAKVLAPDDRDRPRAADEWIGPVTVIETPPPVDSLTRLGSVMGTLPYISPEQAGGEIEKLSARSDVFGLGAMLCQILTGHPPYRGRNANELQLQAVRGDLADAVAALDQCGAEPELVALCKRCLSFRPDDRPTDGAEIATRVAHIRLDAEERARNAEREKAASLVREAEHAKRRRVLMAASGALMAVLAVGVAGTGWGLIEARQARDAERLRADAERKAKVDADAQRAKFQKASESARRATQVAETNLKAARAVAEFLHGLLQSRSPYGFQVTASVAGHPRSDATLLQRIRSNSMLSQQELHNMRTAFETQYANEPATLASLNDALGAVYIALGLDADGEKLVKAALAERRRLLKEAQESRGGEFGTLHEDVADSLSHLGAIHQFHLRRDEAASCFREAITLLLRCQADDLKIAEVRHSLAWVDVGRGQLRDAEQLFQLVYEVRVKRLPRGHRKIASAGAGWAYALIAQNRTWDAIHVSLKQTTTKDQFAAVGYYAAAKSALAVNDYEKAIVQYGKLLALSRRMFSDRHPVVVLVLGDFAGVMLKAGRLNDARKLAREALDLAKLIAPRHPKLIEEIRNWARHEERHGELARAEVLLREALELVRRQHNSAHPLVQHLQNRIQDLVRRQARNRPVEARRPKPSLHSGGGGR